MNKESSPYINLINQSLSYDIPKFKLGEVVLYTDTKARYPARLNVEFIFDAHSFSRITEDVQKKIYNKTREIISDKIFISIEYTRVEFSKASLVKYLQKYFRDHAALVHKNINYSLLTISNKKDYIIANIVLDSFAYGFLERFDFLKDLENYINCKFYEDIEINFIETSDNKTHSVNKNTILPTYTALQDIKVDIFENVVGGNIFKPPYTIRDSLNQESDSLVICGKVKGLEKKVASNGCNFFKFFVDDTTNSILCLFFPRANQKRGNNFEFFVKNDLEVIIEGKRGIDKFSGDMMLYVNKLSKCAINYESISSLSFIKKMPENYNIIIPEKFKFELNRQLSLFEESKDIYKELEDEIVILYFKLDAAGIKPIIVEVAGAKIIKGKIESTFYANIYNNTGRFNKTNNNVSSEKDMENTYKLEEVLPDLYKYTYKAKLIGINIINSIDVLNENASHLLYKFDNDLIDIMEFANSIAQVKSSSKILSLTKSHRIDLNDKSDALETVVSTAYFYLELLKYKYSLWKD